MNFISISDGIICRGVCFVLLLASTLQEVRADVSGESLAEICQLESMKGRCRWNSEVIVMTSARWGRMRTGRCLSIHPNLMTQMGQDPLFLGCSADVLEVLDRKCSGRAECDIRVPDPDLDNVKPCYPDQTRYLEASYTCVRVVQETRTCKIQVGLDEQYISSTTNLLDPRSSSTGGGGSSSSCGAVSHPWRLEAAAGQRINISLIDFAASAADRNEPSRDVGNVVNDCRQYGYVVEKSNKKNTSLCVDGRAKQRERAVYTSETNKVDIVMKRTENNKYNFLIRVQAVGCTNIVPPDNAWLRRSGNDIVMGCYSSQQTWRLTCDGHNWKGLVGTCPEMYNGPPINEDVKDEQADDSHIVLATVVAIAAAAVIICFTIICVGCLCLRRYKFREVKKSTGTLLNVSADNWTHTDNNVFLQGPTTTITTTTTAAAAGTQQLNQPQNYSDNRQQTHNTQYRVLNSNEQ